MRYLAACCCAAVLVGCSKPDQQQAKGTMADSSATTAAAAPTPPPPPPTVSLGDLAGKWAMTTMNQAGDSALVKYELVASSDSTGWTYNFPKRKPVKVHVKADGDSITFDAGPFESVLRKGMQVTTHSVGRLQEGKLVGTTVAHYATKGPDSVRTLKFEGTRAP